MTAAAVPDVLAGLDPEQREVALAVRGPVCVLAGAGTGKTRAITHRIAHQVHSGVVVGSQVLAVTFTTRAAGELRSRLRALGVGGVQARTFHSAALRQLGYFWPRISDGARPDLIETKLPTVRAAATRRRLSLSIAEQRDLASEIEWAKAATVVPADYVAASAAAGREPPIDAASVQSVYATYEEINADRGQIDFEDLLLLMAGAIEQHPSIADEIRAQYQHFTVDEYQDVSPLQQRLLDAWLGDRADLCVVGDPNQTIYSFSGATPKYLTGFTERFPDSEVVRLVRDYRSTNQVVALANRVTPDARLLAQAGDGPAPAVNGYDDEPAEATAAAAAAKRLFAAGTPWSQMAVLYRINAQSEVYESALAAAGVPYLVRGGQRFFARPEIREAMVLLRGALRAPDDDGKTLVETVEDVLSARGLTPEPPSGVGAARDRWDALRSLVTLAEDLVVAAPGAGLQEFCDELAERADAQHAPTVEGVTLASLHAAKGLEWDAVWLVGLQDGTLPITHAVTPEQIAEERRLLYVGVTRARRHLSLSWSAARSAGGQRRRSASRFLIDAGLVAGVDPAKPKRKSAATELDLDNPVVLKLRDWRTATATAAGVPAYVVFDNKTLMAIAEDMPENKSQLATIAGIGPKKLEDYADDVLTLIRDEA